MRRDEMFVLGRIVAPHGVRGEVRIKGETDRPEIFATLPHVYIGGNRYQVTSVRPHKNVYCFCLAGVSTREDAEALVGSWIEMPRSELPPRPEGTYYISDLVGLTVETPTGERIGQLVEVLQPGANDVYVVRGEQGDILVPALKRVVTDISLETGKMIVVLPEWEAGK